VYLSSKAHIAAHYEKGKNPLFVFQFMVSWLGIGGWIPNQVGNDVALGILSVVILAKAGIQ
jgi:hypothetical protein